MSTPYLSLPLINKNKNLYFTQSLLDTFPLYDDYQYNVCTIKQAYTDKQIALHKHIDDIILIMEPFVQSCPQICRSQARDVNKKIFEIGKFINPSSKKCIFKSGNIDTSDTIDKLNTFRFYLMKYCHINIPYDSTLKEYSVELHLYLDTIIKYVKNKQKESLKNLRRS
jgi:hypothetical protein|uniref:Uncharacterized protein n=1 Tax=viral metagenome TaxID=1070528 RepID=A0A6C0BQE0_9ZZZZ